MAGAELPVFESERLTALQKYGILDTAPEEAFDELARLAAMICETPTALVTFVDEARQWFKARVAFGIAQTPRDLAFCAHTILGREVLVVPDALQDPRFATNPFVTGEPKIRAYAGAPLLTAANLAVGSLSVIDYVPRQFTRAQLDALQMLGHQVMAQLELHRRVTETHQRAERASRESDALTASLVDTALDCVIAIDHHGNIIEFNPAAEKTFGRARSDVIGKNMSELIVPSHLRASHDEGLRRYLDSGVPRHLGRRLELSALRADGREFPIELSINRVETDPPVFAGFLRDITQQKEAKRELELTLERFELVTRATNDVIYDRNLETNTVWWSEGFERIYGERAPEAGNDYDAWLLHLHPDDLDVVRRDVEHAISTGSTTWTAEYRFRRPDDTYAKIFDRAYIMRDPSGKATRVIGAMVDLTERQRLEEQLMRSQKMEAIGQLSGGIAHDFNNLLTIIDCNTFLLSDALSTSGQGLEDELASYVHEIEQTSARAASLTRQLLLVSRNQAVRKTQANLNDIVLEMTRMLKRVIGEHVELRADKSAARATGVVDVSMIEQVLINLAVNARDAMPNGGVLSITTGNETVHEPMVLQGLELAPGPYVTLQVADTGQGIPPDVLPRIFEPFFTTKDVGKGTGLGLSTVYGIVRQHRGALDVSSRVRNGTTFTVYLPVASEERRDEAAAPADRNLPRGTETLLIVEDEHALRNGVALFLRRCGYTVLEAESAVAALGVWAHHRDEIKLVMTDMVMPEGMTGRDLAAFVHSRRPDMPLIYTSGYSPELASVGETLVEGENFLEKPYAPIKLAQLIRRKLDA